MAHQLSERLGAELVAAHHGSLAKEVRLDAEERLRERQAEGAGGDRVARARHRHRPRRPGVPDLLAAPHRDAAAARRPLRATRSSGVPKGRIFPLTRDDLIECAAMVRAVRDGELDRVRGAGQAARRAGAADRRRGRRRRRSGTRTRCSSCSAAPIPTAISTRQEFDDVVEMLARGYATRRGRRGALIHTTPSTASCARARARA